MSVSRPSRLSSGAAALAIALAGCSSVVTPTSVTPPTQAPTPVAQPALESRRAELVAAFGSANRITIAPSASASGPAPAPTELRGQYLVTEFLQNLAFEEDHGPVRFDGPTDATFTLSRDDTVIGTLSLRRLNYLRWDGGPWEDDPVLTADSAQNLVQWSRQSQADITGAIQKLAAEFAQKETEARRRMLAGFSGDALAVFSKADNVVFRSSRLRWVTTDLGAAFADKGALAEAALTALDTRGLNWIQDNWSTGALQTALMEVEPSVVLAAMDRLYSRDTARVGMARFFFRTHFYDKIGSADRDTWVGRLGDVAMRAAPDHDKPAVMEFLSEVPGDAAAAFLKSVANGEREYAYAAPIDGLSPVIEEPAPRFAAALLLAERSDPSAADVIARLSGTRPFGPDAAALELGRELLQPGSVPTIQQFRYRSRLLGLAAMRVLQRAPADKLSIDLAVAANEHVEGDVLTAADALVRTHGLEPTDDGPVVTRTENIVDPLMATSAPRRAIEEVNARIPDAKGRQLAELYATLGEAQSELGNYGEAEIAFLNAEQTPYAKDLGVRRRLVWIQWYLGDFDAAEDTIARGLAEEPSSEFLLLRALLHYSQADFGIATEADLMAAIVLDPTDGYAVLFHHFATALGGRPDRSLVRARIGAPLYGPEWPRDIMAYVLGLINADRLLEIAASGDPSEVAWHSCEANFYISQNARVAGRSQEERRYLEACVALNQPHVAEYWLSKFRLSQLDGTSGPSSPPPQQQSPTPAPAPTPRIPAPLNPTPPTERPPATRPPAI